MGMKIMAFAELEAKLEAEEKLLREQVDRGTKTWCRWHYNSQEPLSIHLSFLDRLQITTLLAHLDVQER
jgi:hypothetical protein